MNVVDESFTFLDDCDILEQQKQHESSVMSTKEAGLNNDFKKPKRMGLADRNDDSYLKEMERRS